MDQSKQTKPNKDPISPIFNEQFFFEFKGMIKSQLQETSILFYVLDNNGPLAKDTVRGFFEIDLTSVYFSLNHEIYETSLVLTDPTNEREGSMVIK